MTEKRTLDLCELAVRSDGDSPAVIEGYAVLYNRRSKLFYDKQANGYIYEVIKPGAITDEVLQRSDVIANLEHDNNQMLARRKEGKGSLSLRLDDRGLFFSFPVPNTIDGQRAAERVKRGDIQGCSFEFSYSENECKYTRSEDGSPLRTLNNIHQISDICLTSRPVYPSTTVNRRSLDELKEFDSEAYVKKLRNSINN